MKITFLAALLMFHPLLSWAQGTLNFANGAAGVNAPVRDWNNTLVSGANGWVADLYYGSQGSNEGSLTALGANVAFATGASAGYFFGGPRSINGFPAQSTITVQVRVWNIGDGATYEDAATATGLVGKSGIFDVTLGGGVTPTPNLTGLNGAITLVPEPSTAVLGLFAGAFLVFFGRHRGCDY